MDVSQWQQNQPGSPSPQPPVGQAPQPYTPPAQPPAGSQNVSQWQANQPAPTTPVKGVGGSTIPVNQPNGSPQMSTVPQSVQALNGYKAPDGMVAATYDAAGNMLTQAAHAPSVMNAQGTMDSDPRYADQTWRYQRDARNDYDQYTRAYWGGAGANIMADPSKTQQYAGPSTYEQWAANGGVAPQQSVQNQSYGAPGPGGRTDGGSDNGLPVGSYWDPQTQTGQWNPGYGPNGQTPQPASSEPQPARRPMPTIGSTPLYKPPSPTQSSGTDWSGGNGTLGAGR